MKTILNKICNNKKPRFMGMLKNSIHSFLFCLNNSNENLLNLNPFFFFNKKKIKHKLNFYVILWQQKIVIYLGLRFFFFLFVVILAKGAVLGCWLTKENLLKIREKETKAKSINNELQNLWKSVQQKCQTF